MSHPHPRRASGPNPPLAPALAAVLSCLLLAGCAGAPAPKTGAGGTAAGEVAAVPVTPAAANRNVQPIEGPIPLAPPDGVWLKDEYQRPYFTHKIAKVAGAWAWLEEGKRVQLIRGLTFDVVEHDETSFTVKVYGTPPEWAKAARPAEPTAEQRKQVEASYKPQVRGADRLRFASISEGLPSTGQWRQGFAVADINGDGKLDIVHGPPRKGGTAPIVFLGDGQGRWRRWAEASFPALPFDYGDVAVADFNQDGHLDLAVASHLRGIVALVGDGKGTFTPWSEGIEFVADGQQNPSFSSRAIEAVDWNGDGRVDLLAQGEGPRLARAPGAGAGEDYRRGPRGARVYLNQGDGTWRTVEQEGAGTFGDKLVVADFNGDGRRDFATASGNKGGKSLLNLGKEDGSWEVVDVPALRSDATFRAVDAADFDGDGRPDLAVGYVSTELGVRRTGVDVLLARPGGEWERRTLAVMDGNAGIWSLGAGDLDGNGSADLVALTGDGEAWVLVGDGKGGFSREESPEIGSPVPDCTGYHVELVDVDGDGAAEVLAGFAGETSPFFAPNRCTSGGSLLAWDVVPQGRRSAAKTP